MARNDREIGLERIANERFGKLAKRMGLEPGWQRNVVALWSFLYLEKNAPDIKADLGAVSMDQVQHVLARLIGAQMDVAARIAKNAMGGVGFSAFLDELKETVCSLLGEDDEGEDGPAPARARTPDPPEASSGVGVAKRPPWGVSSYA